MDLSQLPNPYDFANPINDPELFAGRAKEIREIEYYLDHASRAPRPINLAILGERASGKTSVLNMIEVKAEARGMMVVRVDLDEGDAHTELAFFLKVFDSMLITACSLDAYAGLVGRTYDCYRDMVDAYEIPSNKEFCSFIFPIQFAKAMASGNSGASVSDTSFKRDIASIREQVDRPIVILFDECDVLATSRVHLEKLRNVFMNTPGFMLVITGTPRLFPIIDDVFSPIIRQFKSIEIGPFDEEDDTEACIRRPLEKAGIPDPADLFDFETYQEVQEVHELAGGRPYEIQLICHFMFRRVQQGRARRMRLTLEVLDAVLDELHAGRDIWTRPVVAAVRNLGQEGLEALRLLCPSNGHATFEQLWFVNYVLWGEAQRTKDELSAALARLEAMGVLSVDDGIISFSGDGFDRLYCRYFAKRHGVPLLIPDVPFWIHLAISVSAAVQVLSGDEGIEPFRAIGIGPRAELEVGDVLAAMLDGPSPATAFDSDVDLALDVYLCSMELRPRDHFDVATVTVTTPWTVVRRWFHRDVNDDTPGSHTALRDLPMILEEPSRRALGLDGRIDVRIDTFPVPSLEQIAPQIDAMDDPGIKVYLAARHAELMWECYVERGDHRGALANGQLAHRYEPERPLIANNLGYVMLASNDLEQAQELFETAERLYADPRHKALPHYNLGVLSAKRGDSRRALDYFRAVADQLGDADSEYRVMVRLIVPKLTPDGSGLDFEELEDPDLLETAQRAIASLEGLLAH